MHKEICIVRNGLTLDKEFKSQYLQLESSDVLGIHLSKTSSAGGLSTESR